MLIVHYIILFISEFISESTILCVVGLKCSSGPIPLNDRHELKVFKAIQVSSAKKLFIFFIVIHPSRIFRCGIRFMSFVSSNAIAVTLRYRFSIKCFESEQACVNFSSKMARNF